MAITTKGLATDFNSEEPSDNRASGRPDGIRLFNRDGFCLLHFPKCLSHELYLSVWPPFGWVCAI